MTIYYIIIAILSLFVFALMGAVLHLAGTIRNMYQYIGELERDYRIANEMLSNAMLTDKTPASDGRIIFAKNEASA